MCQFRVGLIAFSDGRAGRVRVRVRAWVAAGALLGEEPCHVGGVGIQCRPGRGVECGERRECHVAARDGPGCHGPAADQRERPEQPVDRDGLPVRAGDGVSGGPAEQQRVERAEQARRTNAWSRPAAGPRTTRPRMLASSRMCTSAWPAVRTPAAATYSRSRARVSGPSVASAARTAATARSAVTACSSALAGDPEVLTRGDFTLPGRPLLEDATPTFTSQTDLRAVRRVDAAPYRERRTRGGNDA